MRVYLTRKLAGKVNGVEVQGYQPGDVLDLPPSQAQILVAEGWATEESGNEDRSRDQACLLRAS